MSHPNPPHWALSVVLIMLAYVLRFLLSVLLDIVGSTFPDLLILPYLWTYGFPYEKVWKRLKASRAYYIQVCVQLRRLLLRFLFVIALSLGSSFVCSQRTTSSFTYKLLATILRLGYRAVRHSLGFLFTSSRYILPWIVPGFVWYLLEVIMPKIEPASECPSDVTPPPPLPKFLPPTERLYQCVHCLDTKRIEIDPENKKTVKCRRCKKAMCRINLTDLDKGVNKVLLEPPPGENVQHFFCEYCGTLHDVIVAAAYRRPCNCDFCNSELSRLPTQFDSVRYHRQERVALRQRQPRNQTYERGMFTTLRYEGFDFSRPLNASPLTASNSENTPSQKDSRENENGILTTSASEVGRLVEDVPRVDLPASTSTPHAATSENLPLKPTGLRKEDGRSENTPSQKDSRENENGMLTTSTSEVGRLVEDVPRVDLPASTSTPHAATSENLPLKPTGLRKEDGRSENTPSQKDSRENENGMLTTSTSEVGSLVENISQGDLLPPDSSLTISDSSKSVSPDTPTTSEPGQLGSSCQESPSTLTPHATTSENLPRCVASSQQEIAGNLSRNVVVLGTYKSKRRFDYLYYPNVGRPRSRTLRNTSGTIESGSMRTSGQHTSHTSSTLDSARALAVHGVQGATEAPIEDTLELSGGTVEGPTLDTHVTAGLELIDAGTSCSGPATFCPASEPNLSFELSRPAFAPQIAASSSSNSHETAAAVSCEFEPFDESDTFGLDAKNVVASDCMLVDMDLLGDEHDLISSGLSSAVVGSNANGSNENGTSAFDPFDESDTFGLDENVDMDLLRNEQDLIASGLLSAVVDPSAFNQFAFDESDTFGSDANVVSSNDMSFDVDMDLVMNEYDMIMATLRMEYYFQTQATEDDTYLRQASDPEANPVTISSYSSLSGYDTPPYYYQTQAIEDDIYLRQASDPEANPVTISTYSSLSGYDTPPSKPDNSWSPDPEANPVTISNYSSLSGWDTPTSKPDNSWLPVSSSVINPSTPIGGPVSNGAKGWDNLTSHQVSAFHNSALQRANDDRLAAPSSQVSQMGTMHMGGSKTPISNESSQTIHQLSIPQKVDESRSATTSSAMITTNSWTSSLSVPSPLQTTVTSAASQATVTNTDRSKVNLRVGRPQLSALQKADKNQPAIKSPVAVNPSPRTPSSPIPPPSTSPATNLSMTKPVNMANALALIDMNMEITTGAIPSPRATPPPGGLKKEEDLRIKAIESMRKAKGKKKATAS